MTNLNWARSRSRERMQRHGTESVGHATAPIARPQNIKPSKLSEPIIVTDFWANRRGEAIRIQLREYEKNVLVDVRRHFTNSEGKLQATRKGISLAIARLPDLAAAVNKALSRARELGLIEVNGSDS